jgi:hypothetical protein
MDLSQSKGEWKIRIERALMPLTLGGKAKFMITQMFWQQP